MEIFRLILTCVVRVVTSVVWYWRRNILSQDFNTKKAYLKPKETHKELKSTGKYIVT